MKYYGIDPLLTNSHMNIKMSSVQFYCVFNLLQNSYMFKIMNKLCVCVFKTFYFIYLFFHLFLLVEG